MSIRGKLLGIITLFVLVSLAIGAVGGYSIYRTGNSFSDIIEKRMPVTEQINMLHVTVASLSQYEKEFFLYSEAKDIEQRDEYYGKTMQEFSNITMALNALKKSYSEKLQGIGEIESLLTKAESSFKSVAALLAEGEAFTDVQGSYMVYKTNIADLTDKIVELKDSALLETASLGSKISSFQKNILMVFPAAVAGLILLAGGLGFFFVSRISSALAELKEGMKAVSSGEMENIPESSSEELGDMAKVFSETIEKLKGYMKTEEENVRNQENVINFLEVVSTAAEGDFTKRAPVTTDVFGSIADAFNMMTEELSSLIREVRSTAEEFEKDSFRTLDLLKTMADGSETQMVQLRNATEAIDETAQATLEISEKTQEATGLSLRAVEASQKGEQFVAQSIEGMQLIRASVQIINKKMKMFSERIIEIGTISGMIADISSRTNLLSMNASIEAARAGEAGKGFVVIAEEIRSLADRSADATRDITAIIRSIQTEAGEITSSLEEETEIVEKQTGLAADTKSSFSEITKAVDESKEIISEILPLSQTQRKMTNDVVLSMEHVNRISLDLLRLVQDSESISENLSTSSKELISSVEKFKLLEISASEAGVSETEELEAMELQAAEFETDDSGTEKEVTA